MPVFVMVFLNCCLVDTGPGRATELGGGGSFVSNHRLRSLAALTLGKRHRMCEGVTPFLLPAGA